MSIQDTEPAPSIPKLGENNYRIWSGNMKAYLMKKRVWGHVSGTLVAPTDPTKLEEFVKDKGVASGAIWLGLEESQQTQVGDLMDEPKKMWDELESIHVQKRPSTCFLAYTNLLNIQKNPEESLPSLTARIEKAMQEVKNLRSTSFTLTELDSDLTSMAMIRSLPSEYESFISSITLLPSFDFKTLKEAFINEENNWKAAKSAANIAAAANLARSPPPPPSVSSSSPRLCEFCGMKGHTQSHCYQYRDMKAAAQSNVLQRKAKGRGFNTNRSSNPPASSSNTPSSSEHAGQVVGMWRRSLEMQVSLFLLHLCPSSHSAIAGVQVQGPLHIWHRIELGLSNMSLSPSLFA
jgi:hypothetical protein